MSNITLRPYQQTVKAQAISILQQYGFVYLVMAPRTGKTPTTFSTFEDLAAKSISFITTLGAKPGIKKTYKKCKPGFKLNLLHYDELPKLLEDENWYPASEFIAIDEGHLEGAFPIPSERAVNMQKLVFRAYAKYGAAVKVIFLSGTPSPEDYVQLYHQLNVLGNRNPFGDIGNFIDHYVKVTTQKIYQWPQPPLEKKIYKANKQTVLQTLRRFYISLTQQQAGFKQIVQEQIHTVNMQVATNGYIHSLSNTGMCKINGVDIIPGKAGKLKQKLHQLSGGTIKYEAEDPESPKGKIKKYFILDYSKAEYIKQKFAGQKIAIYYQFIAEFELLKKVFPNYTTSDDEFNERADLTYLGQFKGKREGVDLNTADWLVMYNVDYAALSYWQTIQRHNFDVRGKPAMVAWIFAQNGLEPYIYKKVMHKKDYTTGYFKVDLTYIKKRIPNQMDLFA